MQTRKARVMPSNKERGNSVLNDMVGTDGIDSASSVKPVYNARTTGVKMNEGERPNQGSIFTISKTYHKIELIRGTYS